MWVDSMPYATITLDRTKGLSFSTSMLLPENTEFFSYDECRILFDGTMIGAKSMLLCMLENIPPLADVLWESSVAST